jgi:hypothetical protein
LKNEKKSTFTGNGSNDDQVDGWSQAAARFRAPTHAGIFEYYEQLETPVL